MEKIKDRLIELHKFLDIERRKLEIEHLNKEVVKPNFWENRTQAKNMSEELAAHQEIVQKFEQLQNEYNELCEFHSLGENIADEMNKIETKIDKLEIENMFHSQYDKGNAFLVIHPGAGGVDSCDWAHMLFRMYIRWCERKRFTSKVIDYEYGDVAGIKEATIEVKGKNAYGWLKGETGVHRLVRISPFDAAHRRHTSFASCFVYPLIEDDIKIEIRDSDLRIDTFRASGPGGQYVNKVSSAIRITHLPTGTVVTCQAERSQYQNKQTAMKVLTSRLSRLKEEQEERKLQKLVPKKHEIGWAREIRSYIFCPYTLVKDHRTELELHNIEEIMDGAIDPFMRAWLLKRN
ncbi:MAG: peptide chain release factor 2 [Candidatus Stahlbacteria bacterium]|nr:peptide chain release factor 2 [Candidatus Stahlbacteria bacterium]